MLSDELLSKFWALTKTDMRLETYKIVAACSFSFKQPHLSFIFDQVSVHTPLEKLDMEDFNCLSELGKYSQDREKGF